MFLQIFSTQHICEPTGASTSPMHHDLCWSSTAESAFVFLSTDGQNATLSQKRLNSLNELELTQHVRVVSILIINQQQIKANITIVTSQPEFSATNLSINMTIRWSWCWKSSFEAGVCAIVCKSSPVYVLQKVGLLEWATISKMIRLSRSRNRNNFEFPSRGRSQPSQCTHPQIMKSEEI